MQQKHLQFYLGVCNIDDAFIKKQKHLKAQAFAIKMRPRKETLEVNFVSACFCSKYFNYCEAK